MNNATRAVSQTTHLICAMCGEDVAVCNRDATDVLVFDDVLWFNCPECNEQYDLPCAVADVPLCTKCQVAPVVTAHGTHCAGCIGGVAVERLREALVLDLEDTDK